MAIEYTVSTESQMDKNILLKHCATICQAGRATIQLFPKTTVLLTFEPNKYSMVDNPGLVRELLNSL